MVKGTKMKFPQVLSQALSMINSPEKTGSAAKLVNIRQPHDKWSVQN